MLIDPLVATRAIHFASTILVAGCVTFCAFIADPIYRRAEAELPGRTTAFYRWTRRLLLSGLAVAVASGIVRLVLVAADITGEPWREVIGDGVAWTVLTETQFGLVLQFRLVLAAVLTVLLLQWRSTCGAAGWPRNLIVATAALFLGSLAWAGHASAGSGPGARLHLVGDILHVLAAGAWVGGLVPLLLFLHQPGTSSDGQWLQMTGEVLRRFSTMGVITVATLAASGALNAWFLTDRLRTLFGTDYGQLLQIKIVLFLAMLCLAAFNRVVLLPRLSRADTIANLERAGRAARQLRRNATLELALGLAVLYVVGVLGVTPPTGHMHGG
jgi:copper resistance protein D